MSSPISPRFGSSARLGRRAALALPLALPVAAAAQHATPEEFAAAERAILAGRTPREGGIAIEMPVLSENGNSVDIAIAVESPMTPAEHIRAIHILAERNPVPLVASVALGPRAGRAEIATRIRLATTQRIRVLAETSQGEMWRADREVIVILGACVDGG
jgi:sulfur-oxidizing protein SoxY